MPQPKRYGSDAERQRAYRERQRLEAPAEPEQELPAELDELPLALGMLERMRSGLPAYASGVSEEGYVAGELAVTSAQIIGGLKDHDRERLDRSEAYARWRFRGFVRGLVASL